LGASSIVSREYGGEPPKWRDTVEVMVRREQK
jgi:hypothetical protein